MSNFDQVTLFSGGAGLVSTAQDYMRFADMLRLGGALEGARILQSKTLKLMTRNHLPEIFKVLGVPRMRRFGPMTVLAMDWALVW